MVGILLLLSGAGLIIAMIANRAQNTWPMIGGILLGVAYLIIGYVFITSPLAGILALAVYLAVLFALGGIARWRRATCAAGCRATGCSSLSACSI